MSATVKPRPKVEGGRLCHRLPLTALPREKPAEPIDLRRAEAELEFWASESDPPPAEKH